MNLKTKLNELISKELLVINIELVDLMIVQGQKRMTIRLLIDELNNMERYSTLNVGDCRRVSKVLTDLFDEQDTIKNEYVFEVSTPGLTRSLLKIEDYIRFKGCDVKFKTAKKIDKQANFTGVIEEVNAENISFKLENGESIEIAFNNIQKANLKFDLKKNKDKKIKEKSK